jgi:hypothetical protein
VSFEPPSKADLARILSSLMHETRHRLMDESNRIKSEAIKVGAQHGNRLIITVAKAADMFHQGAMTRAAPILLAFIERMGVPPTEITGTARPHLENLGNSLLGLIPPNGFPADHQRIRGQYQAVGRFERRA